MLLTADAVGGVWTYALELIEGLAERGIEVDLAVMGPAPTPEQRARLPELAGYHEAPYALEWTGDPWEDVERAAQWLLQLADVRRPDLVHVNGYAHAAVDFGVPVLVVGHSCVLSWHQAVYRRPAPRRWDRYRAAVAEGLGAADVVVAPTRAMLSALEHLYELDGETLVIPNGISAAGRGPLPKRPYVLGSGRVWDEAKNLGALERVGPQLHWPVIVAGEGGSLGRVEYPTLRRLLGEAAVFAAPAKYEPFGLAALEAGLAGCALVLGDLMSLREVWGRAALYVDPFGDDALAAALARVIEDAALRKHYAAAARERALEYSRERMAAAYSAVYERLVTRTLQEVPA